MWELNELVHKVNPQKVYAASICQATDQVCEALGTQSMTHGPEARAWEIVRMQIPVPHPSPLNQNLHFHKAPRWFVSVKALEALLQRCLLSPSPQDSQGQWWLCTGLRLGGVRQPPLPAHKCSLLGSTERHISIFLSFFVVLGIEPQGYPQPCCFILGQGLAKLPRLLLNLWASKVAGRPASFSTFDMTGRTLFSLEHPDSHLLLSSPTTAQLGILRNEALATENGWPETTVPPRGKSVVLPSWNTVKSKNTLCDNRTVISKCYMSEAMPRPPHGFI